MQISDSIRELYRRLVAIQHVLAAPNDGEPKIEVDQIVSKLAYFYEKMRNTMDFKEEHLLRRFAIERNLKRRIVMESLKPAIAESMLEELIRSGYLANNAIPESIVPLVSTVLNKYSYLIELVQDDVKDPSLRRAVVDWLAGIAACELDLTIVPEARVDALVETLYGILKDRIKFIGAESLPEREKRIQLYITIHQELVKSDNTIIAFHLLNLYFPDWPTADKKLAEFLSGKIVAVYQGIQHHTTNPIRIKIAKSLKKQTVVFKVLRELVERNEQDLVNLFANPDFLESEARSIIERANKVIRRKLRRSSVRAILYIFITKILLALVLEYPYDLYVVGHINYPALGINIAAPVLLMFFVTLSARVPGAHNTKAILEELRQVVYGKPEQEILCKLKVRRRQGPVYFFFEYLFYVLLYGVIFGAISYGLSLLHFNLLSGGIFIFFVTAVSFFASRIRLMTREYLVEVKREAMLTFVTTLLFLPIIRAGHWLSVNLRRINLFAFILDFIIEAPFKLMVELIESWFSFLREKKEDLYKST